MAPETVTSVKEDRRESGCRPCFTGKTKDYDTIGLWYNKIMFDEAGISYPDETWIWDTLAEAAKKLNKEDGTRISIYNGLGWAAAAGGSHTEEAWKLLEYLGSEEAQKKQAELGVTMSAFKGTSDTWVACAPDFNLQAFLDMSENMVIRPYTKNTKVWEDYSQETMVKAYTGQMSMEDVCKDIAAYMNDQLAEEK